jgi:hypothetical protein
VNEAQSQVFIKHLSSSQRCADLSVLRAVGQSLPGRDDKLTKDVFLVELALFDQQKSGFVGVSVSNSDDDVSG